MDLAPMKRDIDDLISQFSAAASTRFADMKQVWLSKKFSYIYNARPTCINSLALFMQSLYSHSIGHLVSSDSLSRRLGGLYCLYCLYETQPFKPPFKIYLSLEELKKLRNLVADAKAERVAAASAVVKRMLEKKVFLFGCVETNEGLKGKVDQLRELENARIRTACEKLFGDGRIEEFSHMDLGVEVDLGKVRQMCGEYAELKRVAAEEGGKELVGDVLGKIVKEWDEQRGVFYRETGLSRKMYGEEEQRQQGEEEGEDDSFDKELEQMLSAI
ncbi:uncharacterized protein LOC126797636 isoform X2 [Argentina anserina]|uniref:uncharacterized protein LOC126797636 isoform X2 n=1 Tax=Argentina anserina TaxID=57926 RepID=UPI0021763453|nr:uncharacterized protein LOC126797636 isoform X2 [Potentilla anserina]